MSFISKALERAKALQHKREKPVAPPPSEIPILSPPLTPWEGTEGQLAPEEEIDYSFTRTVPVNKETQRRYKLINIAAGGPLVEEYKLLRTRVLQLTRGEGRNTLMVTGPLPKEGKTLTAINLAISLSQEMSQTVLLVDADLRVPAVSRYLGIPKGMGLADHLVDGVPITELLVHPEGISSLVVLPAGRSVVNPVELLSSPRMASLVRELKNYYRDRYVIFDLPPVLVYADTLAFAPLVDGIILVVEAGRTSREDISRCLEMVKNFPVLGLVLNKARIQPKAYEYYHYAGPKQLTSKIPWLK